ncbi:MAG TPA: hypothetical protein VNI57_04570, partial [Candidatus Saccharimonadales bacterium]|nr:hypothetical protein [Candidatus Saccharimonadales bacterium]
MPLANAGYGLDDDAWLMARSADNLATLGRYVPSRLPGYPTAELAFGLDFRLIGTGWIQGNALSSLAGLGGAVAMYALLAGFDPRLRLLAAVALAFHPGYWINSVSTIDFIWDPVLLLASALALRRNRSSLGGLCLALAVGARLTNAFAVVPLAAFHFLVHRRARGTIWFATVAGLGGAGLFVLPLLSAGPGFLQYTAALHRDYVTGGYHVYEEMLGLPFCLTAL